MGFLDKLLGRGKQVAEKGKDVAGDAFDKSKDIASAGLEKAGDAMHTAGGKIGGGDKPAEGPPAEGASEEPPAEDETTPS